MCTVTRTDPRGRALPVRSVLFHFRSDPIAADVAPRALDSPPDSACLETFITFTHEGRRPFKPSIRGSRHKEPSDTRLGYQGQGTGLSRNAAKPAKQDQAAKLNE